MPSGWKRGCGDQGSAQSVAKLGFITTTCGQEAPGAEGLESHNQQDCPWWEHGARHLVVSVHVWRRSGYQRRFGNVVDSV